MRHSLRSPVFSTLVTGTDMKAKKPDHERSLRNPVVAGRHTGLFSWSFFMGMRSIRPEKHIGKWGLPQKVSGIKVKVSFP